MQTKNSPIPAAFRKIAQDKITGSLSLLKKTVDLFLKSTLSKKKMQQVGTVLKKSHPDMAVFFTLFSKLEKAEDPFRFLQKFSKQLERDLKNLVKKAGAFFEKEETFLTLSSSGTLFSFFLHLKKSGKNPKVIICESRPRLEGTLFAKKLAREEIDTVVIADAAMAEFLPRSDHVISGADRITKTHFINKVGTYPLMLLAKHFRKNRFLLTEEIKCIDEKRMPLVLRQGAKSEIIRRRNHLEGENPYFEKIPLHCVSHLITENGKISMKDFKLTRDWKEH